MPLVPTPPSLLAMSPTTPPSAEPTEEPIEEPMSCAVLSEDPVVAELP